MLLSLQHEKGQWYMHAEESTVFQELRPMTTFCLDYSGKETVDVIRCHSMGGNQIWKYYEVKTNKQTKSLSVFSVSSSFFSLFSSVVTVYLSVCSLLKRVTSKTYEACCMVQFKIKKTKKYVLTFCVLSATLRSVRKVILLI